ncbi:MAG: hypothetical protein PHF86_06175 [Candidatus Nanoarchaeia archaeon]|jgi:hypothetical protein|nr:hypothetical protein [Candidatus Nanoarchaeia archaeon]
MKTKEQIEQAIAQCDVAQEKDDAKLCPVWPNDPNGLYCIDCTCRYAWRWVLEIKEMELEFCEKCVQMTNHIDNLCQKCKK